MPLVLFFKRPMIKLSHTHAIPRSYHPIPIRHPSSKSLDCRRPALLLRQALEEGCAVGRHRTTNASKTQSP
jgi:hypothetical protein